MTDKEDDGKTWWPFKPASDDDDEEKETKFDDRRKRDDESEPEPEAEEPPSDDATERSRFVRIILNDAPVPLTGINGCKKDADGLCDFDAFVSSMHTLIGETDHAHACRDDYDFDIEVSDGQPL